MTVAIRYKQRQRSVGEIRRLKRGKVRILRVVNHAKLQTCFFQRCHGRFPSLRRTGGDIGVAGFEVERQILDVGNLSRAGRSGGSPKQFCIEAKYNCHKKNSLNFMVLHCLSTALATAEKLSQASVP
ncbi:hypothetical protein SDC9_116062 [bioreactor metagenome]|uniref:Uncharacterized protein n=1 Tax=bioreactor metagenome TaxID=1076179 RepID=A0A645BVK7_9ZZZZ